MNDHGHGFCRNRQNPDTGGMQLPARPGTGFLHRLRLHADAHFLLQRSFPRSAVRPKNLTLFRFQNALNQPVGRTQDEEGEAAHFPQPVDAAMDIHRFSIFFIHILFCPFCFLLICFLPVKQIFRNPDGHRLYATCYHLLVRAAAAAGTACPIQVWRPRICPANDCSCRHEGRLPGLSQTKGRARNCCADPARNKLCHTGTARKASVPVMTFC